MSELTHIGPDGRARMVDISDKATTDRLAIARGKIFMQPETLSLSLGGTTKKGDPVGISELAGIMGAKRTSDLIPLCHPLPLTSVKVEIGPDETQSALIVTARAKTSGQTGVEMEALTAVSIACLTLYDMLKAADKAMKISDIELIEKLGGKSGHYQKTESP
ncbi:cyclic pyranopterin monophosphate synthase MoaC [Ponticaulis sp.]|uniref:cyclic pyranopterin monophosphate synthase MoaC n=1 Tax=Ponticaulis sp. TaxID=2020902 RepID=UPI000B6BB18A|nr:cyclic pyranopterin monophosphate synthase MoaC [Ponticaulis sp.]MAI89514.1 cyclic pyranopterin monophosphate synthase MoaC [Ponticaulis sp.]OUY00548.1 MAG: cyclic pyranopterin monophosphate synthase MoaC [Hyphomonadaceae bacterium TMED5]|tara:strand:+ start:173744 stop:174229 length:486 start_codon:yes stop_codon:yes gene_type:complete